jgi:multiple antibiotic resistance protein
MSELIQHSVTVFLGFLAIMNPLANTAVFVGLTGDLSRAQQKNTAYRALLLAFCIVVAFALLGKTIFQLFGISLPALKLAGGVMVFVIGYQMLQGQASAMHNPKDHGDSDIAISPLAVPILAGPGTIATAMNFSASGDWAAIAITVVVFAILALITFGCFVFGQELVRVIGKNGLNIVTRLMGLILAIIGMQMLIDGVVGAIQIFGDK